MVYSPLRKVLFASTNACVGERRPLVASRAPHRFAMAGAVMMTLMARGSLTHQSTSEPDNDGGNNDVREVEFQENNTEMFRRREGEKQ